MKLDKNFHTHTERCRHAVGEDEDYVLAAIKCGLTTLGFSDHTPYFYDGDFVSGAKMRIDEMGDYFNTGTHLREKYRDKIEIKLGFETEYFPKFFDRLLEEYRKYPLEYIILGQHFVGDESTDNAVSSFTKTSERSILSRYADQCIEAMETERFSYFAHPDVLNFVPDSKEASEFERAEHERIIRAAIRTNTPLEINLCGVRYGRYYPNPRFWETVGALGAAVVVGCDAHAPKQICVKEELDFAEELIGRFSLNYIEAFPLKNPLI